MRASSPGISLSRADAAIVKAMLARGDRQSDIASYFGVNGGRIAEISTGDRFGSVEPAPLNTLPPPGPYVYRSASSKIKKRAKRIIELINEQKYEEARDVAHTIVAEF